MIAIDTNILLRRILNDDAQQSLLAQNIFDQASVILITDVVLAEVIWTLEGKRYQAKKEDVIALIMSLLAEPKISFEDTQAIWAALHAYKQAPSIKTANGKRCADFSDALIITKARAIAKQVQAPFEGVYTFDLAAQQLLDAKTLISSD